MKNTNFKSHSKSLFLTLSLTTTSFWALMGYGSFALASSSSDTMAMKDVPVTTEHLYESNAKDKNAPSQNDGQIASKDCTIKEALTQAYKNNPQIKEALRTYYAAVEDIPAAKAGWLPNISITATATHSPSRVDGLNNSSNVANRRVNRTNSDSLSGQAELRQNIFDGFGTTNNIKKAKAAVEAAKFQYLGTEQTILFNAAQTYLDLWNAYENLKLRKASEEFRLRVFQQLQAQERVGEKTRTEVAEAQSRYALAIADRLNNEAQVAAAEARYRQIIGVDTLPRIHNMPSCSMPDEHLPKSLDEYLAIALKKFPQLQQADFSQKAQEADIEVRRAALLPSVDLAITGGRTKSVTSDLSPTQSASAFSYSNQATFQAQLRIPIYSGGSNWSGLRRSKQVNAQTKQAIHRVKLDLIQQADANWNDLIARKESVKQYEVQVKAAQLTLEGRRQEYQVGERTLTDTLDAEQALVNAQVQLVQSRRDYILSQYRMVSLMGRLLPEFLNLDVKRNDYEGYRAHISSKLIGTGGLRIPESVKKGS